MSAVERLDPTCPVCGSHGAREVAGHQNLKIVRCLACTHAYVWPVPTSEYIDAIYADRSYYEGSTRSIGFNDYSSLAPARRRMFERHLDVIESTTRRGRILDVGCADGDFLSVAQDRGWEVFGADPSAARDRVLARGVRLVGTTVHDADIEAGSLDAVTFFDVLEHVPDPVADLRRACDLLRPGGVIALTVPDASNTVARASGRRWFGFKTAGEHLQFFSRQSLEAALRRAGIDVRARRPVAWSCTLGFLGERAALYMGPAGRLAGAFLSSRRMAGVVVDMPQINQFALGVSTRVASPVAEGASR